MTPEELFMPQVKARPSKNIEMVMLLRLLMTLIGQREDDEAEPERAEDEEIRVRPRIEPLGGA
jgi:hypothetical protein